MNLALTCPTISLSGTDTLAVHAAKRVMTPDPELWRPAIA
jgi:hypothetical protein